MALKHLAVILDGNRRFAKRLMLEPWQGHEWGAKKVESLMEWCMEAKIKELTIYAFSLQNFNRPKREFDFLMDLFTKELSTLINREREFKKRGLKIRFIGKRELFPKNIQELMAVLERITKGNKRFVLNIAMGYGGREEVIEAVKKIVVEARRDGLKPEQIDEQLLLKNLQLSSEPDLIIRTGGEKRTSNFLPFQSVYSEWIFLDKMWPEFSLEDFAECLVEYERRERRFGR